MSLDPARKQLLRAALGKRSRAELKRLFTIIRVTSDRALFAALAPAKTKAKRVGDPLARDVEQAMKQLLAPSAEKGEMLIEHLAKKHRRNLTASTTGLADAIRRLRGAKLSDEQILDGAKSLMTQLTKLHGRETVV